LAFAALAFGIGIAIGLRYSLLALVPATFVSVCVNVTVVDASSLDRIASAIVCTICIQGGYMIGLTARDLVKPLLSRFSASTRSF
jgi:hypothetical protein